MWGAFGNKPEDDDHCNIVQHTDFTPPGPQQFSIVHSVRVSKDGMVYVADRENRRVQSFTVDGKFVKQLLKGATRFATSVALSPDADQKYLYVGDGDSIAIVDRKSLELIGDIKPPGAIGGGHLIGTDPKGNIYVAATAGGMQKLTFKGTSAAVR
jgi:DNA-binding beta-propeller fold protein YncE